MREQIQKEVLNSLPFNPHGILLLSPRFGKTKLAISIIKRDKPKKILWVTPNTKLRDEDIPNEFIKWKAKTYLEKTDIICYASLSNISGEYDLIILDEIQFITLDNSNNLLNKKLRYKNIIGLTGTLPKDAIKKEILKYSLKLPILYYMSIDSAVDNNIVSDYSITTISVPLDSKNKYVKSGNKDKPFYQTELQSYNYYSKVIEDIKLREMSVPMHLLLKRMRLIYEFKSKQIFAKKFIEELQGRTLVFTSSIANAEFLSPYVFHSKTNDKALQEFKDKKIKTLACVNSGGVGHTFTEVDNLVIVQCDSNKSGNTLQKLARSLVLQKNYKANIYIIYYRDTVDRDWVNKSLQSLDSSKITDIKCECL